MGTTKSKIMAHSLIRMSPVQDQRTGGCPPPVYYSPPMFYTTKPAPSWNRSLAPHAKWPAVSDAFPQRVHSPVRWTNKDLKGSTLRGLDLHDGDLQACDLRGVDLTGTDVEGADLRDAKIDVENCCANGWLAGSKVGAVNWSGKELSGSSLVGVDLSGANLRGTNLANANLEEACLEGACLMDCNLARARPLRCPIAGLRSRECGSEGLHPHWGGYVWN